MRRLLILLPCLLAGCQGPLEGPAQRPHEDSGWKLQGDSTVPTQAEMDGQDEGLDSNDPP